MFYNAPIFLSSANYGVESVPKIEIFYEGEIFRDIPR